MAKLTGRDLVVELAKVEQELVTLEEQRGARGARVKGDAARVRHGTQQDAGTGSR